VIDRVRQCAGAVLVNQVRPRAEDFLREIALDLLDDQHADDFVGLVALAVRFAGGGFARVHKTFGTPQRKKRQTLGMGLVDVPVERFFDLRRQLLVGPVVP
jgi:hypothetical protein